MTSLSMDRIAVFGAGLALLVVGAELVVRGAARLALSFGVKPLLLGLTVVSVGTSAPELAVGLTAGLQGSGSLAVGNIAGTNVVNILLILGLSVLLRPLPLQLQTLKLELPVMVGSAALLMVFAWDGVLTRLDGGVMLVGAVLYTVALIRVSRQESRAVRKEFGEKYGAGITRQAAIQARAADTALLAAGLVLSVLGAHWLVSGAVDIARGLGVSEALIGLTIVAVGTSAPELTTTIVATFRGERDVAVGNLLGSSIYNILVILAITCLAPSGGVPVERHLRVVDIPLMTGVAVLCVPVFVTGRRVSRLEGCLFVTMYMAYVLSLGLYRT